MRCDYLLASRALAAHARSYQVIRTPTTVLTFWLVRSNRFLTARLWRKVAF